MCYCLWLPYLESMFAKTRTFSIDYPLFSKCLPFCDVSAGFNVMEGEKKLSDSNLIIKYSSCSNFNLGRQSKIVPVIGGYSKHSLVDQLSPIVLALAWDTIRRLPS